MFKNKKTFLLITAFTSGMSIMALEISASRLLAPHFGTSLFVWTNIIGVVMIALSAGYYWGGKLADRRPQISLLLKLILTAGIIFLFIPWLIQPLSFLFDLGFLSSISGSVFIFFGSLLVTLILFAFPLSLLGMVSPFIIKLCSQDNKQIGNVAGSVFALSTVGSIIGTFLPTLWLIGAMGTKATITIFALALIVIASVGLVGKKYYKLTWLILLMIPLWGVSHLPVKATDGLVFEDESVYQYLQVVDEGNKRYLIYNEGGGFQSAYSKDKILTGMYYDYFATLPYLIPTDEKRVLILGLAGGIISKQLDHYFGNEIKIDGVEIDGKVIAAANQYFDLQNDSLTVYKQDGRVFLQQTENKYNLIIVDAYQKQMYIPWTLTTQEFWREASAKLSDQGLVVINVNASSSNSSLLQAIANSMASIFPNTYLAKAGDIDSWNYMIVASNQELDWDFLSASTDDPELLNIANKLSDNIRVFGYNPNQTVLTDDKAPIEFMVDSMIVGYYLDYQ
ncbi:MAG: fused MFS/spermidine synthase [Parcubacteria group bacterium]